MSAEYTNILITYIGDLIHLIFEAIGSFFSDCYPFFCIFSLTIICFVVGLISKFINLGRRS